MRQDAPVTEEDMGQLKEQLATVDPSDPPLMPGQVALNLAHENDVMKQQIEVLKN